MRNLMPDNPFEIISEAIDERDTSLGVRRVLKYLGEDCFLGGIFPNLVRTNLDDRMQFLQDHENNFFRHWMIVYWQYWTVAGKRNAPFKFANGKWDLDIYNDNYFTKLKEMLDSARRHGLIVQLTLFDRCGLAQDTDPSAPRWSVNPWNKANNNNGVIRKPFTGLPEFFTDAIPGSTLAKLQNDYVAKVVRETREFPNVVYEIINEPMMNQGDHNLAVWANTILGVMAPLIQGRRLVFYNSHNGFGGPLNECGRDVKDWKANAATLTNYDRLDGIILHGDPNRYDPVRFNILGWNWAHDKVLQGSSDAFGDPRHTRPWNKTTATRLFERKQLFQAETDKDEGAAGIQQATPKTTRIKLPSFLGCWHKTSTTGARFDLRFDGQGRFLGFNPETDQVMVQGNLLSFTATEFTLQRDGQTDPETYTYSLSADRSTLTYLRVPQTQAPQPQEFERMPFDFEPFLFGWRKFRESERTPFPNYLLHFGQRESNLVFRKRDATNPATIIDHGTVPQIDTDIQLPRITTSSQLTSNQSTYAYDFYFDGQRRPCLMIENVATNVREDFRRTI